MMYRFQQQFGKVARRCMSTQSAAVQQDGPSFCSKLSNGLKIATSQENAPAARVVLLVNTGSRDDTPATLGLTHCLQACAGLTSSRNTAFLTSQLLASLGADLEVTASRDHILYHVNCYATAAQELILDVLTPAVLGPIFPWWEIRDMAPARMRYQKALAENDPSYALMETAHKVSFRGNFSNPVMSPDYMIGNHTSEMLSERFQSGFSLDNMVLAATGISHGALKEIGSSMQSMASGSGVKLSRSKPEFISSEAHLHRPGPLVHTSLTFEGVALNDKDALALAVLQKAMGSGSNVKRASGLANGMVNRAVEKVTKTMFSTSAFSANYSDCGLFGLSVVAPVQNITSVVSAAAAECHRIARQGIDEATLQGSKQRLKAEVLMSAESGSGAADIAVQASTLGSVTSASQIATLIDSLTVQNIAEVAKRVLGGKKSLSTIGQCYDGPFLQDL